MTFCASAPMRQSPRTPLLWRALWRTPAPDCAESLWRNSGAIRRKAQLGDNCPEVPIDNAVTSKYRILRRARSVHHPRISQYSGDLNPTAIGVRYRNCGNSLSSVPLKMIDVDHFRSASLVLRRDR
jgi:hypothetical protein